MKPKIKIEKTYSTDVFEILLRILINNFSNRFRNKKFSLIFFYKPLVSSFSLWVKIIFSQNYLRTSEEKKNSVHKKLFSMCNDKKWPSDIHLRSIECIYFLLVPFSNSQAISLCEMWPTMAHYVCVPLYECLANMKI